MSSQKNLKDPNPNFAIVEEAALTASLERRPEPVIPEGFAVRVAAAMPPKSSIRERRRVSVGKIVAYLALAAMAVVLLVLTRLQPEALETGRGTFFGLEVLLLLQVMAIGLWLGIRSDA